MEISNHLINLVSVVTPLQSVNLAHILKMTKSEFPKNYKDRIVIVNEHNTSKCCHVCGNVMGHKMADKQFYNKKTTQFETKSAKVYSILHCTKCSQNENGFYIHRDGNASRNILNCFVNQLDKLPRPVSLMPRT